MARNDVHAPASANFDPQAYDLRGLFDLRPEGFGAKEENAARVARINEMVQAGYRFAGATGGSNCGHCGTRIRYAALMVRSDVMEMLYVGETCLDERFSLTKAEFTAMRERSAQARREFAKAHGIALLLNERPALRALAVAGHPAKQSSFVADIAHKLFAYGEISERQADAVENAIAREVERQAQRAQWAADREAEKAAKIAAGVAAPLGRVTVTGTVLVTKEYDGDYGTTYKMLVEAAEGWKVWSSIPASILGEVEKGTVVTFTATLALKDAADPTFAKASRPTKASVLEVAA